MGNIKPWKDLTIQDDYMFKLVMRSKHICKTIIEKILKIKLTDIRYIDEEKTDIQEKKAEVHNKLADVHKFRT